MSVARTPYTKGFYELQRNGATRSAEVIVPLVMQLLAVQSVVDVGCGDGSWLAVFRRLGINETLGMDGEYVERRVLQIPADRFRATDLTKSFALTSTFDLAISLEVGEHLPANCAAAFVEDLTRLAPAILFSAAIPHQGGVDHVNEQWPDKWAALFAKHGFLPVDCIRKRVWRNDAVEWWYAQNTLLFVKPEVLQRNAALKAEYEQSSGELPRLVHPKRYLELAERAEQQPPPPGVKAAARLLFSRVADALRRRAHLGGKR